MFLNENFVTNLVFHENSMCSCNCGEKQNKQKQLLRVAAVAPLHPGDDGRAAVSWCLEFPWGQQREEHLPLSSRKKKLLWNLRKMLKDNQLHIYFMFTRNKYHSVASFPCPAFCKPVTFWEESSQLPNGDAAWNSLGGPAGGSSFWPQS